VKPHNCFLLTVELFAVIALLLFGCRRPTLGTSTSDDYPVDACVNREPYGARTIVNTIYSDMLFRWEQRTLI